MQKQKNLLWIPLTASAALSAGVGLRWLQSRSEQDSRLQSSPNGESTDLLESRLQRMTLEEKIGQMFMVGIPGVSVTSETIALLRDYHIGGVILFKRNMRSLRQTVQLNAQMQRLSAQYNAGLQLFIATDQEGGRVTTLNPALRGNYSFPSAEALGRFHDARRTIEAATHAAATLRRLGLNMNLAPVLDVLTEPKNPIIRGRAFGANPHTVIQHGRAYIQTLQHYGVLATAKHFPGHGATTKDSHHALPLIRMPFHQWTTVHLPPFRAAVEAQVAAIMTAHVAYEFPDAPQPRAHRTPATFSKYFITEILREHLAYEGLVITDCMLMRAVQISQPDWRRAVLSAVDAGVDIILISSNLPRFYAAYAALERAVHTGELPETRLDESVRRILRTKVRYSLLRPPASPQRPTTTDASRINPRLYCHTNCCPLLSALHQVLQKSPTCCTDRCC